uniref:Thaumatin-like protein n=2 Tax=Picea sitchensis TaxID=3332 RepID=B8LQJ2_PICSI|nr:unknown [Picea sitchensis]
MARAMGVSLALMAVLFVCAVQGVICATFEIRNECSFTVWAAGTPRGGGQKLERGQSWTVEVPAGTTLGRFWGRTGCSFDGSGRGSCKTGDCGGVLNCQGWGNVPATLAEYALNQYQNLDFYDISLVDGFNLPMIMIPSASQCTKVRCSSDINSKCPAELRVADGCKSACAAFNTPQYCCTGSFLDNCPPTDYSRFFKGECPQAYSYARDDATSTFTCPGGTNYKVVFCGAGTSLEDNLYSTLL